MFGRVSVRMVVAVAVLGSLNVAASMPAAAGQNSAAAKYLLTLVNGDIPTFSATVKSGRDVNWSGNIKYGECARFESRSNAYDVWITYKRVTVYQRFTLATAGRVLEVYVRLRHDGTPYFQAIQR